LPFPAADFFTTAARIFTSAATAASTSSFVLYIASDMRVVAWMPKRSITG